jgi:hypothetical protein
METKKTPQSGKDEKTQNLNLFEISDAEVESVLEEEKKGTSNLGFTKLSLDKNQDSRFIKVRLLPNFHGGTNDHKNKLWATVESVWIDFKQPFDGSYDSQKSITGSPDVIEKKRWQMWNAGGVDKERSDKLKAKANYYTYALIMHDSEGKLEEGSVHILRFSYQLKELIKDRIEGNMCDKCSVYNTSLGATFNIRIKRKNTQFYGFDKSDFSDLGTAIDYAKYSQKSIVDGMNALKNLDDFKAKPWTDDQHKNADLLIKFLNSGHTSKSDKIDLQAGDDDDKAKFSLDDNEMTTDEYFNVPK